MSTLSYIKNLTLTLTYVNESPKTNKQQNFCHFSVYHLWVLLCCECCKFTFRNGSVDRLVSPNFGSSNIFIVYNRDWYGASDELKCDRNNLKVYTFVGSIMFVFTDQIESIKELKLTIQLLRTLYGPWFRLRESNEKRQNVWDLYSSSFFSRVFIDQNRHYQTQWGSW